MVDLSRFRDAVVAVACVAFTSMSLSGCSPAGAERELPRDRINVLFLGDNGHHEPSTRAQSILPFMRERGVNLSYTDDLSDLTPETLSYYHVLMLYANHEEITSSQEEALLDFVNRGGGLVAIHCASGMFRNSDRYIELIGGAFESHGEGVFSVEVLEPDHPAKQGVPNFESWDETYIHARHTDDKTVLSQRVEDGHAEPWTWVREEGDGRVFYTAWGHDERTWSNEGFRQLLWQGTRWAAGDWALELQPEPYPYEYTEVIRPSLEYGTSYEYERQPRPMQLPLTPEESMSRIVVPPGFRLELFASEPDIVKPVAMAWDERGRLWVLETVDYPNDLQVEPEVGNDRITILEDTNGDGRADNFTVFADGLSIPTSLAFANGGVIVATGPHMKFFKDTTGDDRADVREILFDGWGTFDTHAGPSNLRMGFDNWIWGVLGYSGFEGNVGGQEHLFTMGFYRFRPDGSELEYIRSTNNNTWGLGFSEEGLIFASTANNNPSVYMPIPNRYYEAVRGWSPVRLGTIAPDRRVHPITERTIQGDHKGMYTSGAGHALYTARSFPREYWNRISFVADPTVHLVGRFAMERQGSDFVALNKWNMLASDDEWVAPIKAEVGPDGALWVIDWYNFIPQHNLGPFEEHWEHGAHNAYETDLRDKERGRIYRIVHEDAPEYRPMRLDNANPRQLVDALRHENMFWRQTAQRLLVERGDRDVLRNLYRLIDNGSVDDLGLNPGAIHALWTLHGLGALDGSEPATLETVRNALEHPSAAVRRTALMVLPRSDESLQAVMDGNLMNDEDPQVRKAALLALSEMPPSEEAGGAVYAMLTQSQNYEDQWIPDAATAAGARHDVGFLMAAAEGGNPSEMPERVEQSISIVAGHYARVGPVDTVVPLLSALGSAAPGQRRVILEKIGTDWPEDRVPALTDDHRTALDELRTSVRQDQIAGLADLLDTWYESDISESQPPVAAAGEAGDSVELSGTEGVVTVTTPGDIMEYDVTEIRARAGSRLTIRYVNGGNTPTMTHNVVVIQSDDDIVPVGHAALRASDNDYIPPEHMDRIIAYTSLAPPGGTVEVTFTVPPPGRYPYICTFGGHFMAMQGVLISVE